MKTRVKFKKQPNNIWYSDHHIYIDDEYTGFMYKIWKHKGMWKVVIGEPPYRDFYTFNEAKEYVKSKLNQE